MSDPLEDLKDGLALALGYHCQIGPALAQAASERGRASEGWGHERVRPARHTLEVVHPPTSDDPFRLLACDECHRLLAGEMLASLMPGMSVRAL